MDKTNAILSLKLLSGLTILLGLIGIVIAVVNNQSVPLFTWDVPGWVIGVSVTYMGVRYWRRIPEMQRTVQTSSGFSWSNFKRSKS